MGGGGEQGGEKVPFSCFIGFVKQITFLISAVDLAFLTRLLFYKVVQGLVQWPLCSYKEK